MAARVTMAELITFTRRLIGDPTGAAAHFTDDDIQATLDTRRQVVKFDALAAIATPAATVLRYDYISRPFFESGATFQDRAYAAVTPNVPDYMNGLYSFTTGRTDDLYISGKRYDPYGAAGDLADEWMGALKDQFDYSAGASSFKLSQQIDNLSKLSARLHLRAEGLGQAGTTATILVERSDTL